MGHSTSPGPKPSARQARWARSKPVGGAFVAYRVKGRARAPQTVWMHWSHPSPQGTRMRDFPRNAGGRKAAKSHRGTPARKVKSPRDARAEPFSPAGA